MIKISQLTTEQLPYALMQVMGLDVLPIINWELCGKLIEQEKISLIFFGTHWIAMEINSSGNCKKATQKSKYAIDAVIKCFMQIKLGRDIIILQ